MREVAAKTILSPYRQGWFGSQYNMNLYRGCCHGCIYCDSRSACYGISQFDQVRKKRNALELLEGELRARRRTGVVMTGSMSDPYNPFEEQERITRGALELFARYGYGVVVMTKSHLVERDIDLFLEIARHAPVLVNVTVTTADDGLCRKLEPHAAVSSRRLAAVKALSDAGVPAGVLLMPVLPFLEDSVENVRAVVERSAASGACHVYNGGRNCFGVTLRQNQRAYFFEQLDRLFPGLSGRYRAQFGQSYDCRSPNAAALWRAYCGACEDARLAYRMEQIARAMWKPYETDQISLF